MGRDKGGKHREENQQERKPKRERRDEGPAATGKDIANRNARRFWQTQEKNGKGFSSRKDD